MQIIQALCSPSLSENAFRKGQAGLQRLMNNNDGYLQDSSFVIGKLQILFHISRNEPQMGHFNKGTVKLGLCI